jgi:hypothetical protein
LSVSENVKFRNWKLTDLKGYAIKGRSTLEWERKSKVWSVRKRACIKSEHLRRMHGCPLFVAILETQEHVPTSNLWGVEMHSFGCNIWICYQKPTVDFLNPGIWISSLKYLNILENFNLSRVGNDTPDII